MDGLKEKCRAESGRQRCAGCNDTDTGLWWTSYEIARKLLEGNKVEKNIIIQPELILQGGAERKE